MPVTMRDVAQRVGVSKQTVSAVLNGKPGISAATTARVWQAIAELGYQPNLVASSLRHGYTRTIGLLVTSIANPWFAEYARGAEDSAQARGYSVILCNTNDDPVRVAMYQQILKRNKVAGILGGLPPIITTPPPSPIHGRASLDSSNFDHLGAYVATAHLLDLGHRRIGCITAPSWGSIGIDRLYGYKAALVEWGVPLDDRLIVEGKLDYASGERGAEYLLALEERPSAIFAHQDLLAIGAIAALRRMGVCTPEDMAVIGYDGIELAALYAPPLSTIIQPIYKLGVRLMTTLLDQIEGRASDEASDSVEWRLAVRQSTVAGLRREWISQSISSGTPWRDWRTEKGQS